MIGLKISCRGTWKFWYPIPEKIKSHPETQSSLLPKVAEEQMAPPSAQSQGQGQNTWADRWLSAESTQRDFGHQKGLGEGHGSIRLGLLLLSNLLIYCDVTRPGSGIHLWCPTMPAAAVVVSVWAGCRGGQHRTGMVTRCSPFWLHCSWHLRGMPRTTKVSVWLELKVGKACHLTPRSSRVDAEGLQVVCVCVQS